MEENPPKIYFDRGEKTGLVCQIRKNSVKSPSGLSNPEEPSKNPSNPEEESMNSVKSPIGLSNPEEHHRKDPSISKKPGKIGSKNQRLRG